MAGKITMMSTLIMLIFLSVFLYSGLEKVKAADTEDTITFPIDGILCHQQAGELFDEINEERAKRGIHELIWDSGYEKIAKIRSIETSVYFSHLLPSAEETLNIGVGKYNRSIVTECLTCGSLDVNRAFLNWMEEPGHRASILGEWKYAACGIFGIMRPNGWKVEYYFVFIAGFDPISGNENRETGTERVSGYPVVLAHPEERITGISLDGIVNASGVYVDCYYRDSEWPSRYVEVVFSFKGNYMGTVQKTVSVPIPEGECGNSLSVPETPGQGEENSQAGNSNNSGGKSMPSVPPARMQSDKSDGSRSVMQARTGIKVKTGDRKSNKTASPTPSKKRTENRSEEVPVRSDLKKPKLRSVKCSKKGSLKISWKKDRKTLKKVDGYEIQVSSDRRFAREVRTVLVKKKASGIRIKVKGQKLLYIRIRYYSPRGVSVWSKTKKVRIRRQRV